MLSQHYFFQNIQQKSGDLTNLHNLLNNFPNALEKIFPNNTDFTKTAFFSQSQIPFYKYFLEYPVVTQQFIIENIPEGFFHFFQKWNQAC